MTDEQISEICKALGDSNRLKIIRLLTTGPQCAQKLLEAFKITQPTLSHHMRILASTGLVLSRREGKWTYYEINCCKFKEFKCYFEAITCWKDNLKTAEKSDESCCCQGKGEQ